MTAFLSSALATLNLSSSSLDTQVVTTGGIGSGINQNRLRGWSLGTFGSISDGTSNIYSGSSVDAFYWDEGGEFGIHTYTLSISSSTNDGWTQVTIGPYGKILTRSSAGFFGNYWIWTTLDDADNQAFGAIGSVHTCVFT